MKRIYSIDIFDTVLTRNVLYPKDVFHLVQYALCTQFQALPVRLGTSFWGERVWAEFIARRKTIRDDISITDIYQELGRRHGLDSALSEKLMELELEIESTVLQPVHGASILLDALRKENAGLVFISDMYLPSGFIREVLERYHLYLPGDRVYVSGEKGITKGSGKLFSLVLQEIGIQPHELVHYGDNLRSDYLVPKSMGIKMLHETGFQTKAPFIFALKQNFVYLRELIDARIEISGARHV